MPSKSKKQHNFMEAIAHSEKFAKKVGIPQSVGKDFVEADKGKKFRLGGSTSPSVQGINKQKTHHGQMQMPNAMLNKYIGKKEGGVMKHDDVKQDKAMIKKAFRMHDAQEHKGEHTNLSKLKKGGMMKMAKGGVAKTVTKEMEYDYKTGKKSFRGDTAQRDRHAEKEGKMVAKHAAYDKAMGMKSGGRIASKGDHPIQKQAKRGAEIIKMAKGGLAAGHKSADGIAIRGKTRAMAPAMRKGGKC
jgi:hypothetical protein